MRKWFNIFAALLSSLFAVSAYLILVIILVFLTGCAPVNESQIDKAPELSEAISSSPIGPEHTPASSDSLWLPVRKNPVSVGAHDFYAILADGTLVMWGYQDDGPITEEIPYKNSIQLKDHAVAVYASPRNVTFAIDTDGSLWSINTARFYGLVDNIDLDMENEPMKPVKVMDDVSMSAVGQFHSLILKRDGSLWVQGFSRFGAAWLDKQDSYLVKVMDNIIWTDITAFGGYAITANHELWSWGLSDDGEQPKKILDNVAQISSSNLVLTDDGELVSLEYDYSTNSFISQKTLLHNAIQCSAGLAITADGALWLCGTENQTPQKVGANVLYAAQGDQVILALHEDGSFWTIDVSSDSDLHQETPLS